jgi:cytidylate kinase
LGKKITIAIDGYSSTGKSTLAKQLAEHLGYVYVDTGAMYRAVTLFAMQNGYIDKEFLDKETLIQSLPAVKLEFRLNEDSGIADMYLNGENVEDEIRTINVSNFVREQQKMGEMKGIVMDGRDIGTVVFPNADLKIFMTSSPETRAQRRYDELLAKKQEVTYEEVFDNVKNRDHIDTSRKDSPLKKADDAVEIDNSELTREEQFAKVVSLVQNKL